MYGRLKDRPVYLVYQFRGGYRCRSVTAHASRVCNIFISLFYFENITDEESYLVLYLRRILLYGPVNTLRLSDATLEISQSRRS